MGNARFPQYRTKKRRDMDTLEGFKIGVWTATAIFRDKYDVPDDEVGAFLEEAHELLLSFGTGQFKPDVIFKDLENRTGIKFNGYT